MLFRYMSFTDILACYKCILLVIRKTSTNKILFIKYLLLNLSYVQSLGPTKYGFAYIVNRSVFGI